MRTWLDIVLLLCLGGSSQESIEDVQLARAHLWLLRSTSPYQPPVSNYGVVGRAWTFWVCTNLHPGSHLHWRRWDKSCPHGNAALEVLGLTSLPSFAALIPLNVLNLWKISLLKQGGDPCLSARHISKMQWFNPWMATCNSSVPLGLEGRR